MSRHLETNGGKCKEDRDWGRCTMDCKYCNAALGVHTANLFRTMMKILTNLYANQNSDLYRNGENHFISIIAMKLCVKSDKTNFHSSYQIIDHIKADWLTFVYIKN